MNTLKEVVNAMTLEHPVAACSTGLYCETVDSRLLKFLTNYLNLA
jgi:hypothetical protein